LVFFATTEFMEAGLRSKTLNQQEVWARVDEIVENGAPAQISPYESFLLRLRSVREDIRVKDILDIESGLSALELLRALNLVSLLSTHREGRIECRKKAMLLLEGIDAKSKKLWLAQLQLDCSPSGVELVVNADLKAVRCHGATMKLDGKANSLALLLMFNDREKIDTESASRALFDAELDSWSSERLRVLCHRTNRLLGGMVGLQRVIKFTKRELTLSTGLRIRASDVFS